MSVRIDEDIVFDLAVPVLIVGGGACGSVAALAAQEAGAEVVVLERDPVPSGSTAMSSGMIPACGTRLQAAAGVEDTPSIMAGDIRAKARGEVDTAMVEAACGVSGSAIDWLTGEKQIDLTLVDGFLYPGHRRLRMHAPPSKTGAELIGSLSAAVERQGIDVMTDARVSDLHATADGRVTGVVLQRPDGSEEAIGCEALVLACNGFGGNPEMVERHIPSIAGAPYHGHAGNTGDAVVWGTVLGGAVRHMGAFQGHGSLAHPHNTLITWALMMEGGFQVNADGNRFSNEHLGYSEQAAIVQGQPGGVAWDIYDGRLHELGMSFEDYRQAEAAGAVRSGDTPQALAEEAGLPPEALAMTIAEVGFMAAGQTTDPFARDFTGKPPLAPPLFAVKVTGALFHTQGGLAVDTTGRVLRQDGTALPNLFAGGGAACGLSGSSDWGYLSGNGLLMAVVLGRLAGMAAAAQVRGG